MDGSFFVFLAEHQAAATFALMGATAVGIALWRHTEGCKKARTELRESVKKSEDTMRESITASEARLQRTISDNTAALGDVRERLSAVESSNSANHVREMQTLLASLLDARPSK